jgi:hypothetical protein
MERVRRIEVANYFNIPPSITAKVQEKLQIPVRSAGFRGKTRTCCLTNHDVRFFSLRNSFQGGWFISVSMMIRLRTEEGGSIYG